jgi:hypothetical protein
VVEQPDFDRVVKLLEAEGRALTPPPGALQRVIARAAAPQQRPQGAWMRPWMRPALAALTVAVLLVGLSGGAYASTPGQPLFNVQRALDDAYLALPRSPQAAAHASIGVAERRVAQATNVKAKVSEDTLRATSPTPSATSVTRAPRSCGCLRGSVSSSPERSPHPSGPRAIG